MQKMPRRRFLKSLGAMALSTHAVSLTCSSQKEPLQNVVVIIGDDHAAYALGCYGNDIIRTPNLDKMATRGMRFEQAFANAPLCSASRQSLLTGKYPHAAGVTLLFTPFPEEQYTIAEHLQKRNFRTGYVGKMHFNNNLPHGFESRTGRGDYRQYLEENPPKKPPDSIETRSPWKPFRDPARIWLNADMLPSNHYDEDSIGTWYAHQAIDFIRQHQNERFCLWVGFHEPHSPFNFPIEYRGKYDPENMPLPKGSPEDDQWIPEVFRDLSEKDRRGIIASYYTSVEYLDKNVGLILDELNRLDLDKNTLVIYLGDHGYLLNHHKRFEKHMMWEEAVGAPLIILGGDRVPAGVATDVLTGFVDLAPTICDMLGIERMPELQGKSLQPVLENKTEKHRDYVYAEFMADNKAMIRSHRWKYIFTSGKHDLKQGYATGREPWGITHRLYDLKNDPEEHHNVAKVPENQDILHKLQQKMIEWFKETYPNADKLPEGLSVDEKLTWFCRPTEANPDLNAQ